MAESPVSVSEATHALGPVAQRPVWRWHEEDGWEQGAVSAPVTDAVAQEVPVAVVVNGISHAVMMASPADLDDFALGFLYTEGIIDHADDLYGVDTEAQAQGLALQVHISAACEWRLKTHRRAMAGRTGCGVCGVEALSALPTAFPRVAPVHVSAAALQAAHQAMLASQPLQALTGGTHAAAWCSPSGEVMAVREDVGRHNALDKLIGALLRQGASPQAGWVMVSSRLSYEMVQKTLRWGAGGLAALSAPTQWAIDLANDHGLTLVGFVRPGRAQWYTPYTETSA